MEGIAVGDLHMDGSPSAYIPNHSKWCMDELQTIIDWGADRGINRIFQLGDWGHYHRLSHDSIVEAQKLFARNPNTEFHIILGNHCMLGSDPEAGHSMEPILAAGFSHVNVYTKPTNRVIDGARVRFLPYPHRSFDRSALNFAHVPIKGVKNDNGTLHRVKDSHVPSAVCIVGDIHGMQRVANAYYPGTPYQTRMGESVDRYFAHFKFESPSKHKVRMIPHIPQYRLHTVRVSCPQDLEDAPSEEGDLIRLVIQDGAEVVPSMWDHLNVVEDNKFKTREELSDEVQVELEKGSNLEIEIPEFLDAFLTNKGLERQDTERILDLRTNILKRRGV